MSFRFLETGPLIDKELELVAPQERWVDALMRACEHPLSAGDPNAQATSRARVTEFLQRAPLGHQPADPQRGWVPCYFFWMHLHSNPQPPPIEIAGGISLRVGHNTELEMYGGHIGYGVYPPARGHHYAERACRLLLPLARHHDMRRLWITCNPDNVPSRRTCERLGCKLVEIVPVPPTHPLYQRGDREKCRYYIDV
ncbi:MAG TPA: GNAT family N-acetyltransferase [Tepidisphaeraceae bacterium]|jgi:tagatose 1,6-diphosphate aldolase